MGIWVWSSSNTIYTDTFVSDGTYITTSSDSSISSKTGTWSKIQNNEYLVKRSDGKTYTWIYHPATDTITQPEYPNVPSYRQGKQPVTTVTTVATPEFVKYSSSGDYLHKFNVVGAGNFLITGSYSGKSYFVVNIKDSNEVTEQTVFNEFGSYSGRKVVNLPKGSHYLDVRTSGPWTIEIIAV